MDATMDEAEENHHRAWITPELKNKRELMTFVSDRVAEAFGGIERWTGWLSIYFFKTLKLYKKQWSLSVITK